MHWIVEYDNNKIEREVSENKEISFNDISKKNVKIISLVGKKEVFYINIPSRLIYLKNGIRSKSLFLSDICVNFLISNHEVYQYKEGYTDLVFTRNKGLVSSYNSGNIISSYNIGVTWGDYDIHVKVDGSFPYNSYLYFKEKDKVLYMNSLLEDSIGCTSVYKDMVSTITINK